MLNGFRRDQCDKVLIHIEILMNCHQVKLQLQFNIIDSELTIEVPSINAGLFHY